MFENQNGSTMDRRSFLRGSALFATALGLAVVPAFAQEPQQQQQPPQEPEAKPKEKPKDPFDTGEKPGDQKKLVDKEGREYRICPQCGYNMYKEGRMWVCENCGYSYVE
jgi:ribosomal protein S27AE